MKILYVHGFRSSGNAGTADRLRRLMPDSTVISPDLPVDAHEALELLRRIVEEQKIDVVVGTSMGGMLAQKLRGIPKVIVNPSFSVSNTFRKNMGTISYFSERADGAKEFEITPDIVKSYEDLERNQFDNITQKEKDVTTGAFGNRDDVVDCKEIFKKHYDNIVCFDGGHRLDEESLKQCVVPAIRELIFRNMKKTDKELYEELIRERYNWHPYQRNKNMGENMEILSELINDYWRERYLINHNDKTAYELQDQNMTLSFITKEDVDWESVDRLPNKENAYKFSARYPVFYVDKFEKGTATVKWTLYPDGMFFMDEDGFGMEDNDESALYGKIDCHGRVVEAFHA